jgi:hypothetical protein
MIAPATQPGQRRSGLRGGTQRGSDCPARSDGPLTPLFRAKREPAHALDRVDVHLTERNR